MRAGTHVCPARRAVSVPSGGVVTMVGSCRGAWRCAVSRVGLIRAVSPATHTR